MKRLILIIAIALLAIFFGYKLSELEGRIVIDLAGTIIQLSLLGAAIFIVFGGLILWLVVWLIIKAIRVASGSRNWLGALSSRHQRKAFYGSINAMLMNENDQARKLLSKSTKGDFNGVNFLIGAELERQAGNQQQAQAYLIQAMDYPESEPLALMKQAELCLQNNQAEEAMTLLSAVEGKIRQTKAFVELKLEVLKGLNDWPQIEATAKENKKLLGDAYLVWAEQWTTGEFAAIASKNGAKALQQHWQQLGRAQRKDHANQLAYVQLLLDQGLSGDAEEELVALAGKDKYPALWRLFKQINHANPSKAMKFIELEIKNQPDDPELYSVLANIAYNVKDYALAHKAILKALELRDNNNDKALLALILEQNNDYQQANALYRGLLN